MYIPIYSIYNELHKMNIFLNIEQTLHAVPTVVGQRRKECYIERSEWRRGDLLNYSFVFNDLNINTNIILLLLTFVSKKGLV